MMWLLTSPCECTQSVVQNPSAPGECTQSVVQNPSAPCECTQSVVQKPCAPGECTQSVVWRPWFVVRQWQQAHGTRLARPVRHQPGVLLPWHPHLRIQFACSGHELLRKPFHVKPGHRALQVTINGSLQHLTELHVECGVL